MNTKSDFSYISKARALAIVCAFAFALALQAIPGTAYAAGSIPWNEALGVDMDTFLANAEAHRTAYYGTPYSQENRYGGPGVGMDCSSFWSFLIMNEGPVPQSVMQAKTGAWGGYNTTVSIILWVKDNDIWYETGTGRDLWEGKIRLAKGDFVISTGEDSWDDLSKLYYSASHVAFYWGMTFSRFSSGMREWHSTNGVGNSISSGIGGGNVFVVHGSGTPDPIRSDVPGFDLERFAGETALGTMSRITSSGFYRSAGGTVILASADGYWDALTAAGIAGVEHAPVLMTAPTKLSAETKSLLERLKPKKILVCGGTSAVSNTVANAAAKAAGGAKVERCAGKTATGTANAVFKKMVTSAGATGATSAAKTDDTAGASFNTAFVCTNDGYWDALASAPISYAQGIPIFLSEGANAISAETLKAMKNGGIEQVYVVGGTSTVSDKVVKAIQNAGMTVAGRFGGRTAVETSEQVADFGLSLGMSADHVGLATVNGYWDALTGAAYCGTNNNVLLLVNDQYSHSISGFIGAHAGEVEGMYVFGGYSSISPFTEETAARTALGI